MRALPVGARGQAPAVVDVGAAVPARLLGAGGRLASVVGATGEPASRDDVTVTGVMATYTPDKLRPLLLGVAAGTLSVPVSATHPPLADAPAALRGFAGGKLGKIVVTVP